VIEASDMQVVIPSRKRVESCRHTITLFKNPIVCVDESEAEDYADVGAEIVTHPRTYGLGELRQWILDNFPQRVVVQCNDDVKSLQCCVGRHVRKITDADAIQQILLNSANIAEFIGTSVFTYSPYGSDVRMCWSNDPIRFNRIEGCLFGMIGRKFRFDPKVRQHDDLDLTFQVLLKDRIVYMDSRFAPEHDFMTKAGGNSEIRGNAAMTEELKYMRSKWGKYFGITRRKSMTSTAVGVKRRQQLKV